MLRLVLLLLAVVVVMILVRTFRLPEPNAREGDTTRNHRRMSRAEALEVLGLRDSASREEMLSAYRSLIRKVHPDSPGGSNYLASKLNQAKETLLG